MTTHSEFRKGQRIMVIMKDGSRFVDKFKEKKSGVIITNNAGRVPMSKIRSATIYRGGHEQD